jgi:dienelactone hydrolase
MQAKHKNQFIRNAMVNMFVSALALLPAYVASQPSPERLKMFYANYSEFEAQASKYSDLKFNADAQKRGMMTNYHNGLVVPSDFDSTKKYPVLIVLPSCNGVSENLETVKGWVDFAVKNGMVAYSLETMRNNKINCNVPQDPGLGRAAKDVLDVVKELNGLVFVDGKNIFGLGESLGAMTLLVAASEKYADRISPKTPRLNSVVSLYGRTMSPLKRSGGEKDAYLLDRDTTTPILFLAGALDTETPPEDDQETFDAFKASGRKNFEAHVLKDATHCWNCKSRSGFTKRTPTGKTVVYTYNKEASDKAEELILDFIKKNLKR